MDPEVPQDPQEPQHEQPATTIDPRAALEIAAQQYGVTPDVLESSLRLQSENQRVYEENRRRARELELKEAQIEALARERQRYAPPEPVYDIDPAVRPLYEKLTSMERRIAEREQREADQERLYQENQRTGVELNSHYETLMRQVPTQSRVDQQQFFAAMAELWPNAEFKQLGLTPGQAVERTARYLGIKTNGGVSFTQPSIISNHQNPLRDPRASVVIPGGASSSPSPSYGVDAGPQRPGETIEQYSQRIEQAGRLLQRQLQESGVRALPDRYSSG